MALSRVRTSLVEAAEAKAEASEGAGAGAAVEEDGMAGVLWSLADLLRVETSGSPREVI
jgi:hypothetical protein